MPRAQRACPTPGCPNTTSGGRCPDCVAAAEQQRGTPAQRGYDWHWQHVIRPRYLRDHPFCVRCAAPSRVPDHWPESRRQLVARGVPNPDADQYLRALCTACHNGQTAVHQPGGWAAR